MADSFAHEAAFDGKPNAHILCPQNHRRIGLSDNRLTLGLSGQQSLGIGVSGMRENLCNRPSLDNFATLHHTHIISNFAHNAQIMRDE